jgi:vacuolar-type H+-ATPase subunit D/Vma8
MMDFSKIRSKFESFKQEIPIDDLNRRLTQLEEKYQQALQDIVRLEEENIETTNLLYEIMNSLDAVDRRIDILDEHHQITEEKSSSIYQEVLEFMKDSDISGNTHN